MSSDQELLALPAWRQLELVRSRQLSAVELVEAAIRRVEALNPRLNAIVTLSDKALEEAREADRRLRRDFNSVPLCGLPVGIKDVTPVAGLRTTFGSPVYADHVAEEDALVVRRLRRAGAVILGKTNTPEFAAGGHTFNEVFGPSRNPWNPELSPGGSTGGGAAALATGMISLAEGTDLGGSLRIPASFCGVVGLRPSAGLVPTVPSDYLWDTLQVTGPMGRTAEDVAWFLEAAAGSSAHCPVGQSTQGRTFVAAVRRGVARGARLVYAPDVANIGVDPEIEELCRSAAIECQRLGLEVEERKLDLSFGWKPFLTLRGYWMLAHHHHRLDLLDRFGPNLKGNLEAGLSASPAELGAAEQARSRLWREIQELFAGVDYLVTPCMAVPPFPVGQNYPEQIAGRKMKTYVDWIAPTFVFSLSGLPAASVPVGLDSRGLPVGLQIVGPPRGEEAVLALAATIQKLRPMPPPPGVTATKS